MDILSPFPLVLPQKGLFCNNHLGAEHTLLSICCHIVLFIYSQAKNQHKECNHSEDNNDNYRFHYWTRIIQHYCLVWISVLTSPRGRQLDFWLIILVVMDVAPIVMSFYHTVRYFASLQLNEEYYDPTSVIWRLTSAMRSWSPAYQLNNLIMEAVDGSISKHVYILIMFTLVITQIHKFIVSNVYCVHLQ